MVEEIDFDGAGGVAEDARELDVGGARRGIAARMVVRADDGGGRFANGGAEHFARMRERGGGGAGADFDAAKETIFAVQAEHPEFFDLETLGDGLEVGGDEIGAIEEGRFAGLLADDASRDLHDGEELEGLYAADAFQAAKVFFLP